MAAQKGKFKARAAGGGTADGVALVAGVGANADIAIAGLTVDADVYMIVKNNAGTFTDVTSQLSVVKAGAIQLNATSAGTQLTVYYQIPLFD